MKGNLWGLFLLILANPVFSADLPGVMSNTNSAEYSPNGITVAGGNGFGFAPNQLGSAVDIFLDAASNIYICDYNGSRIIKWAPGASTGTVVAGGNGLGSAANQLNSPNGIYVDAAGNIYIADLVNGRIQKWAAGASSGVTVAGGNGTGSDPNQFYFPTSVFVDAAGNIYVSDVYNHRVQKWAPGGAAGVTVAGGHGPGSAANQLNSPDDVVVDAAGNLYIADTENDRVQKWAPGASTGITVAGGNGRGSSANQLARPNNIFVDMAGNVFVTDNGNHRIQKWASGSSSGITVAGGNGKGSAASQLDLPRGIFLDASGNIYVCDNNNFRIQKFSIENGAEATACPANLSFVAPSCDGRATIRWAEPRDTFPASFQAPVSLDPGKGLFTYLGAFNGHGYYISSNNYWWRQARDLARSMDGNGHLVTLNSASENNFIYGKIKGPGYAPWIGLFNTGREGRFRWVHNEFLSYTNWAPGEPNNYRGNARSITEPYVRMSDLDGRWNDQQDDRLQFIVEFERPLIRFKQISGPKNGSVHKPGVYQVCYERINLMTNKKDTCCFNITISCNATMADRTVSASSAIDILEDERIAGLHVLTSPNPSKTYFRLRFTGNNKEQLSLKISDITGRILEVRNKVDPTQTVELGSNLKAGVYFVQVMQGKRQVVVKVVKE